MAYNSDLAKRIEKMLKENVSLKEKNKKLTEDLEYKELENKKLKEETKKALEQLIDIENIFK